VRPKREERFSLSSGLDTFGDMLLRLGDASVLATRTACSAFAPRTVFEVHLSGRGVCSDFVSG
jgi:hypothetical protein